MALLPRGVGARRVGVMVAQSGASRPGDVAGGAAAGRREAEGSRERAPPRALKAAGLRTQGRVWGAGTPGRRPPARPGPRAMGRGGPGDGRPAGRSGGRRAVSRGARPSEVGRTAAGRTGSGIPRAAPS